MLTVGPLPARADRTLVQLWQWLLKTGDRHADLAAALVVCAGLAYRFRVAAEAFREFGAAIEEPVRHALASEDPVLRKQTAAALARNLGATAFALDALEPLTRDKDLETRRFALSAVIASFYDPTGERVDPQVDRRVLARARAIL